MNVTEVVLVDAQDNPIGSMEKMEAHEKGLLHRAFSVFIFDPLGKMLLQRRAYNKYHSPGLWTNACCSHPKPGDETIDAAYRRLQEEMGFICLLEEVSSFTYRSEYENGLTEHEFDHIFIGTYSGGIRPNPAEVSEYKWAVPAEIDALLEYEPESFTSWFRIAYPLVMELRNKE